MTADKTPLSGQPQAQTATTASGSLQRTTQQEMHQRTRSQELVEDHHNHIVDEDPLLISQSLTYVTDDGSVLHSFQSAPFSLGG
jgi:hypothetical protein